MSEATNQLVNEVKKMARKPLSVGAGVVLTVNCTCPVPVMELGSTKQAASPRLAGKAQVRPMRLVYPVATLTATLAIAAEPTAAAAPEDDRAKFAMEIGMAERRH